MARNGPVTRADLPQFTVASVDEGERDSDGLIEWRLRGRLNRVDGVTLDGWSFLLLPGRDSLTGTFDQPQGPRHETTFTAFDKDKPEVDGLSLACLGPYHRPHHVWMVEEGPQVWEEGIFAASDAIADNFIGADGKSYRRTRKAGAMGTHTGFDDGEGPTWTVPGGWDHEHCEICNAHIDPGDRHFYFSDRNAYLCTACYQKHVLTGSIEFALPPDEERSKGEETLPE